MSEHDEEPGEAGDGGAEAPEFLPPPPPPFTYYPPGEEPPPDEFTYVPDEADGDFLLFPPGVPGPIEDDTFGSTEERTPSPEDLARAIGVYYGGSLFSGGEFLAEQDVRQALADAGYEGAYDDPWEATQAIYKQTLGRTAAGRAGGEQANVRRQAEARRQAEIQRAAARAEQTRRADQLAEAERDRQARAAEGEKGREGQERSRKVATAEALIQLSSGPMGPGNYRMALSLLSELFPGLPIPRAAGGQAATKTATGEFRLPNLIRFDIWDAMSDTAKELTLQAYEANGGKRSDWFESLDAQRTGG